MFTNRLQKLNIDTELFERVLADELANGRAYDYCADADEYATERFQEDLEAYADFATLAVLSMENTGQGFLTTYDVRFQEDFTFEGEEYEEATFHGSNGRVWSVSLFDKAGLELIIEDYTITGSLRELFASEYPELHARFGDAVKAIEEAGANANRGLEDEYDYVESGHYLIDRLEDMAPEELEKWKMNNYVCEECGELVG